jgi:hypothetical protein
MTEEEHINELTGLIRKTVPQEMTDDDLRARARQVLQLYQVLVRKPPKK